MSISATREDPRARSVRFSEDGLEMIVSLDDGRRIAVPLSWFPRLLEASDGERRHWTLLGGGQGIHWPDIDEDVQVAGLLEGA